MFVKQMSIDNLYYYLTLPYSLLFTGAFDVEDHLAVVAVNVEALAWVSTVTAAVEAEVATIGRIMTTTVVVAAVADETLIATAAAEAVAEQAAVA